MGRRDRDSLRESLRETSREEGGGRWSFGGRRGRRGWEHGDTGVTKVRASPTSTALQDECSVAFMLKSWFFLIIWLKCSSLCSFWQTRPRSVLSHSERGEFIVPSAWPLWKTSRSSTVTGPLVSLISFSFYKWWCWFCLYFLFVTVDINLFLVLLSLLCPFQRWRWTGKN